MSDLLNSASLVMIPSGYKEDTVFSAIPTDGSGDLSFTRASNATRINSAGLVEVCPWNLLQYSEDFSNVAWVKDASTISSNAINAPNGTLTADLIIPSTTSATDHRIRQSLPNSVGNFNYSVYVKSGGYNWVKLRSEANWANVNLSNGAIGFTSGVTPTVEILSDGWYRISFSVVNVSGGFAYVYPMNVNENSIDPSAWAGNGTSGVYLWGAQLNIGSTAKPYFPTTDRLNVPRLTYQNGGGGCPALLLEPQRTNLMFYSEQFDDAYWTKSASSITSNSTTAPDGTSSADTLLANGASSAHSVATPSMSFALATSYSVSVFVKKGTNDFIQLFTGAAIGGMFANFNINAGTVGTVGTITGSNPTSSITNFGNGWYRCTMNFTTFLAGSTLVKFVIVSSASAAREETNTLATSVILWGAQLELGAYPTTYIPTTTASATRVADACFKTGISSLIGQTEGTFFVETEYDREGLSVLARKLISANDGSSANLIDIYVPSGQNSLQARIRANSTTLGGISTSSVPLGKVKIAYAYKANDYVLYINGVQIGTVTTGGSITFSSVVSTLQIGDGESGADELGGKIGQVVVFKTRLTNAELASLTTL